MEQDISKAVEFMVLQLTSNDFLIGAIGFGFIGGLFYKLGTIIGYIKTIFVLNFTNSLTIRSEDKSFDWVSEWFNNHPHMKKCRRVQFSSSKSNSSSYVFEDDEYVKKDYILTPSVGTHLIWNNRIPLLITRSMDEERGNNRKETIKIMTLGRKRKTIEDILNSIKQDDDKNLISAYSWVRGYFSESIKFFKRPIESIFIQEEQKKLIMDDFDHFLNNKEWYQKRGVPYRRGYLFSGPPGTGKTSIIKAIASHFDKPIALININSVKNDMELIEAFHDVPDKAIIVIEDIDACGSSKKRRNLGSPQESEVSDVTLSGLLNTIDGVASGDDRILIMTTNHPETLDPALLRAGRVDQHYILSRPDNKVARSMFVSFYPNHKHLASKFATYLDYETVCQADLQNMFMRNIDNPHTIIDELYDKYSS